MAIISTLIIKPKVLIRQTSKKSCQEKKKHWQRNEQEKKTANKKNQAKGSNANLPKKIRY